MIKSFLIPVLSAVVLWTCSLSAGSIRLTNDSPYKLRAVIRGADGTYLGEMLLNPEHGVTWNDSNGQVGHFGKGNIYQEGTTRSQTPYTVLWYCIEGDSYSVNDMVSTGALVTALNGTGARMCKAKKRPKGAFPQQPEGQYLHPEEEKPNSVPDLNPYEE